MGPSVEFQLLVRCGGAGFSLWQNFFRAVPIRNSNKYWGSKMQEIQADIKFLSKKFNISERYARDIFLEARMKNGVYDFLKCVVLYVEYRDQQIDEINAKRDKLAEVKAETALFKLNILKREYHHSEDVELFFTDFIAKIKSKVMAIPNRLARKINGDLSTAEIEAILKDATDEILIELGNEDNFEITRENYGEEDRGFIQEDN